MCENKVLVIIKIWFRLKSEHSSVLQHKSPIFKQRLIKDILLSDDIDVWSVYRLEEIADTATIFEGSLNFEASWPWLQARSKYTFIHRSSILPFLLICFQLAWVCSWYNNVFDVKCTMCCLSPRTEALNYLILKKIELLKLIF